LVAEAGIGIKAANWPVFLAGAEAFGQMVDDAVVMQALVASLLAQAILPGHAYLPP
jgi:hypothetical protein